MPVRGAVFLGNAREPVSQKNRQIRRKRAFPGDGKDCSASVRELPDGQGLPSPHGLWGGGRKGQRDGRVSVLSAGGTGDEPQFLGVFTDLCPVPVESSADVCGKTEREGEKNPQQKENDAAVFFQGILIPFIGPFGISLSGPILNFA